MKISFSAFLLLALVFSPCVLELTLALAPPPTTTAPSFCDGKCGDRCAQAGYQDRCLKYCKICCEECKCVPSGTYGNKSECPCYRDKLNAKGKPKCP